MLKTLKNEKERERQNKIGRELKEKIRGREVVKDNSVENFEEWKRERKTE